MALLGSVGGFTVSHLLLNFSMLYQTNVLPYTVLNQIDYRSHEVGVLYSSYELAMSRSYSSNE